VLFRNPFRTIYRLRSVFIKMGLLPNMKYILVNINLQNTTATDVATTISSSSYSSSNKPNGGDGTAVRLYLVSGLLVSPH
jgi:hypothetical protein